MQCLLFYIILEIYLAGKEIFMIMFKGIFNLTLNSFRIRFRIEFGPAAFLVLILQVLGPLNAGFFYLFVNLG